MSFREFYQKKCIPEMVKKYGYKNPMQVPKLEKIILSSCLNEATSDKKVLDHAAEEFAQISGQKPIITKAKKSIATFKLRKGMPLGVKVTLRNERMYEFFSRLVNVALPRTRDFRGIPDKGFDGKGNFTLGLKEQIVFPEILYDKIDKVRGMNVTIVTTAKNDDEGRALLQFLGMPFQRPE